MTNKLRITSSNYCSQKLGISPRSSVKNLLFLIFVFLNLMLTANSMQQVNKTNNITASNETKLNREFFEIPAAPENQTQPVNQTSNQTQQVKEGQQQINQTFDPNKYANAQFSKQIPSLISEVLLANSTCFSQWLPAISFLSDYEQAILVQSAMQNKDDSRCIDCQYYSQNLFDIFKKNLASLVKLLNIESFSKRDPFRCLLNLITQGERIVAKQTNAEQQGETLLKNVEEEIGEYVYYQAVGNHCTAKLVKELSLLLAQRRRFFCATKDDIAKMAIFDDNNNIIAFKWTLKEAEKITFLFNQFAECNSLKENIYPQTFNKINGILAKTKTCGIEGAPISLQGGKGNESLGNLTSQGNNTAEIHNQTNSTTGPGRSLFSTGNFGILFNFFIFNTIAKSFK